MNPFTLPIPSLAFMTGPLSALATNPPKFSGKIDDWFVFAQDWERHQNLLRMMFPGMEIPDYVLLETLNKSLDEISQKLLQKKREENAQLRFQDFWGILQDEFSSDSSHQHRAAWYKVKLDITPPLTGDKWKKFQRDFELRKGRVLDWTENEEYDLLFNQLPEKYQLRVATEENKRRKDQFWVKVTNLSGLSGLELQKKFSDILEGEIKKVEEVPKGFLVECGTERLKRRFLGMDGFEVNGQNIRVSRVEKKMKGTEIFALVGDDLKVHDEIKRKRGNRLVLNSKFMVKPESYQGPLQRHCSEDTQKRFAFRPQRWEAEKSAKCMPRISPISISPNSWHGCNRNGALPISY